MSKYSLLFISLFIVIIMTVFTAEITALSVVNTIDSSDTLSMSANGIKAYLRTFIDLLSFDVQGLPATVNVIFSMFFIPLNLVIGYIIMEILVKVLQVIATAIPF